MASEGGSRFGVTSCHVLFLSQLLSKGAFGYLLPIVSFVLAWLETWFLDFKVLPQEAEEERCECWGLGLARLGLRRSSRL